MLAGDTGKITGQLGDFARRLIFRGFEDGDNAVPTRTPPLTVAAASGLSDLIKPRLRSPDSREVLNQRGPAR